MKDSFDSVDLPVELWADDGAESELLRQRLRASGIPFREKLSIGENVPGLCLAGTLYSSRDGINFALNALIGLRETPTSSS